MRIAMLTNNYKPFVAGVPISIERLSEGLKALGHEVYIFAPTYENQVEEEGVIHYRSYKRKLDGNVVIPNVFDRTIEKQFKALDIDIIHAHHPNMIGWIAQYLGKKYKIPVVYTYHTRYEQYLHHFKPFERLQHMGKDEGVKGKVAKTVADFTEKTVVPKVVQSYANACETVFASKSETQGIVLLEAMAAHNPVVAVEASGVVEVVRNNENGYMTAEDTKEWAARIAEVMDDEALATTLKEGAYKTAKAFGSEEVARCAAQYYRQAIKGYAMIEDTLYKETYVSL
ncbi:MAG: glycosyltransferase [Cellulosilyticaceae bacterium]